jgi:2-(1,2-epoxy-1,2-dihydrophenyl)acetyl-CoA isomerase
LVTEVVPNDELSSRADALAAEMAAAAGASNAAVKKLLLMSFGNGLEEQMEIEGRTIAACADHADGREGIDAFLNKRAPKFA